ncbi:MAG TPA: glycosyltransferase [Acidimicrobiales bacterium]|jgi:glycosyltransferase involved in cell wall biosynthesis|nr:glycosyltransferase [Acidimicrobiales bacterium]
MLKVALDGRRLQDDPPGGVGRTLREILGPLAELVELSLLYDRRRPVPPFPGATPHGLAGLGPLPETGWLQLSTPVWLGRHRPDVFHGTFNAIPLLCPARSVVSIYDLAWKHHPEDLGAAKRRLFAAHAAWAAGHSEIIVTVSEFTRAAIIDTYRVPGDRVVVVPPARPVRFGPERAASVDPLLQRLGIRRPFVVAIGGARRRGLAVAVAAWQAATADLGADRPQLVVVGREPPPAGTDLVGTGPLDDPSWAALLAAAEVLCYPTRYEGFGLPALEAAASGTPVVCAPVGSLPEVLGEAGGWAASPSVDDMATVLHRIITDSAARQALADAGLARASAWPATTAVAGVMADVYERAAA